jgi:hypothetical protein
MADIARRGDIDTRIVDATTQYSVAVNSDGSINVVVQGVDLASARTRFLSTYESSVGTSETDIFLIKNPSGSGKYVFLDSITITAVTGGRILWVRGYEAPTITSDGTAQTEYSAVKESTPQTAVLTTFANPTISARGSRNFTITSGQYAVTSPIAFNPVIVLAPNYNFLFTMLASSVNSNYAIDLRWREITA